MWKRLRDRNKYHDFMDGDDAVYDEHNADELQCFVNGDILIFSLVQRYSLI